MNRGSVAGFGQIKFGSIFHLDQRTITQANNSMTVFCGANFLALLQLCSGADSRCGRVGNLGNLTFSRLHSRVKLSVWPESLHERNGQEAETDDQSGGDAPTHDYRLKRVT